jgi:hypothetical protein
VIRGSPNESSNFSCFITLILNCCCCHGKRGEAIGNEESGFRVKWQKGDMKVKARGQEGKRGQEHRGKGDV